MTKKKNKDSNSFSKLKKNDLTQFALGLLIIILLNIISAFIFTRIDLTSEKRYSLSEATKTMLDDIDDLVFFRVYLEGEFPAGFKKLARETREMLDEMRAYNSNIEYKFINPSESTDKAERDRIYQQLIEKGLNPTDLQVKTKDGTAKKMIFPGTIATYHGREMPIELLVSQRSTAPEEILNNSIQNLEFAIADGIRKLVSNKRPKIAFIEGHGELDKQETADATLALWDYYNVERVRIDGQLNSLTERKATDSINVRIKNKFAAIIIAKPDSVFSNKDKFIIDQYIMRGGKVLWLIDPVFASMDSLQVNTETMGVSLDLNLTDMFFKYGIRLNNDLVMDLNAMQIPVQVGEVGGQPQYEFFPWFYFPILTPLSENPIVRNLNALKTEFISSIDFVNESSNIDKTILLTTSRYSRTVNVPVMINLAIMGEKPDERMFNKQDIPVAALLEGTFESVYANRMPPEITEDTDIDFREVSKETKMIVIADGDIIRNQMQFSQGNYLPLPLGYDRYTGQQFGNKELILNAMNYLTENEGLISIRSKELKLRLLDRTKVENERTFWQILNVVVPVVLVLIFGLTLAWMRKRRYAR